MQIKSDQKIGKSGTASGTSESVEMAAPTETASDVAMAMATAPRHDWLRGTTPVRRWRRKWRRRSDDDDDYDDDYDDGGGRVEIYSESDESETKNFARLFSPLSPSHSPSSSSISNLPPIVRPAIPHPIRPSSASSSSSSPENLADEIAGSKSGDYVDSASASTGTSSLSGSPPPHFPSSSSTSASITPPNAPRTSNAPRAAAAAVRRRTRCSEKHGRFLKAPRIVGTAAWCSRGAKSCGAETRRAAPAFHPLSPWRFSRFQIVLITWAFILTGPIGILRSQGGAVLATQNYRYPSFDMPMENVTVAVGQTAVLTCPIKNLGRYKVLWLQRSTGTVLTLQEKRISSDERISLDHSYKTEWNLNIKDVNERDRGEYECQVNTDPPIHKLLRLQVLVPPRIIDHESSRDMIVPEFSNVTLVCTANGVPKPIIKWFRQQMGETSMEEIGIQGEVIMFYNVTRECADLFECVATNGVPPAVSKQIKIDVEFAPTVKLRNTRLGQQLGKETILECIITAYPHSILYWQKDGSGILTNSGKYHIDTWEEDDYTMVISLRIKHLSENDYGEYKCVASNSMGRDQQTMTLYKYVESGPGKPATTRKIRPPHTTPSNNFPKGITDEDFPETIGAVTGKKNRSDRIQRLSSLLLVVVPLLATAFLA